MEHLRKRFIGAAKAIPRLLSKNAPARTNAGADAPPRSTPPLSEAQLETLCKQGYVAIDLPPHLAKLADELFARSMNFFGLPDDTKSGLFPSVTKETEQGYMHIAGEKEYITLRYLPTSREVDSSSSAEAKAAASAAAAVAPLESTIRNAWREIADLLYRTLKDVSQHIGQISPTAWDALVTETLQLTDSAESATPTLMRIFRYEPRGGVADVHRDLGILTLCICRGRGLEVLERAPPPPQPPHLPDSQPGQADQLEEQQHQPPLLRWTDAPQVVVMVGDTLRVLSTNRVPAASHRVVATDQGRQSIVFALRPSTRARLDLGHFGGHGVIDAAALWERIRKGRVNVNAQKDVRAEQRARWQQRQERNMRVEDVA